MTHTNKQRRKNSKKFNANTTNNLLPYGKWKKEREMLFGRFLNAIKYDSNQYVMLNITNSNAEGKTLKNAIQIIASVMTYKASSKVNYCHHSMKLFYNIHYGLCYETIDYFLGPITSTYVLAVTEENKLNLMIRLIALTMQSIFDSIHRFYSTLKSWAKFRLFFSLQRCILAYSKLIGWVE